MNRAVVGIYDSGIGGLSILRALRAHCPGADFVYLADQAHVPYGEKSLDEIRAYARGVCHYAREQGWRALAMACNTASAAALHPMREEFPDLAIIGMEPAVKPAAAATQSGVIAVLATQATFQGVLFETLLARHAGAVTVLRQPCPGLVNLIEAGDDAAPERRARLLQWIPPLREQGADCLVLGCTHYPLITDEIAEAAGAGVKILDPSEAVARQTARVLQQMEMESARLDTSAALRFLTTGDQPDALADAATRYLGISVPTVSGLAWMDSGDGAALSPR